MTAPSLCGVRLDQPRLMGILNVTPDSFSDGGQIAGVDGAVAHARAMVLSGADFIDVGGESTRPGAAKISVAQELDRVIPVIEALKAEGLGPVSIDTRKAEVMREAAAAGADLINDVSALTFEEASLATAAKTGLPVILMHAQGTPDTMQAAPSYDDVVAEVDGFFSGRIAACEAAGLPRSKLVLDPGIGFGKTLEHNLVLMGHMDRFAHHGCPLLLGASRKSFIERLSHGSPPDRRLGGSLGAVVAGLGQGVMLYRVHDVHETSQFLSVYLEILRNRI